MSDDAVYYGPQLPAARRRLFRDDDIGADEADRFRFDDDILAEILDEEEVDVDFGYDDEYSGDSSSIEVLSDSGSSIDVLSDWGSSIEVLEDYSVYTDEGIIDDDIMYSPYRIMPPQPAVDWNVHNAYYQPVSPINPSCLPWSPESWNSRDLYSPMSSPASHWGMAGDAGHYSPEFFSMDGSFSDASPMYWDVSGSTYKTAEDINTSCSLTNSSFFSAPDFSSDDCY